ncbi:MAG: hypothetical protein ACR2GL_02480 [Thermoleophilaceae bacterium]
MVRPPGGGVAYGPGEAARTQAPGAGLPEAPDPPGGLSASELKLRERALAVLEGHAAGVAPAAQLDAIELALDVGVLQDDEAAAARAWRKRRLP